MSKIQSNSIIKNPTDLLDGATTDHIGDRSAIWRSDSSVSWSSGSSTLTFASDIVLRVLNTKSGTFSSHVITAGSISGLSDGEVAYVVINRDFTNEVGLTVYQGTSLPAQGGAGFGTPPAGPQKDVIPLCYRIGNDLWIPLHKQLISDGTVFFLGQISDISLSAITTVSTSSSTFSASPNTIILCTVASGGTTITLPAASTNQNTRISVKFLSGATQDDITVQISGPVILDYISGIGTTYEYVSDGTNWQLI